MPSPKRRPRGRPVDSSAGYRRIAAELRVRLISGEWRPGTPLPSLRALAREYRVSLDVVRAAMRVMREEDRVGVSGFRRLAPTPLMSVKPEMQPSRALLIVYTSPLRLKHDPGDLEQVLLGMLQGAGERQAPVMIAHSYTLRSTPPFGLLQLAPGGLLVCGAIERDGYALYERLPVPVVLVDRPAGRRPLHSVAVDNERAMRETVARLAALGHRRIAFLRRISLAERDVDPDSRERQAGFKKGLKDAGLPFDSANVYSLFASDNERSASARAIADPASGYTAAVCADPGSAGLLALAARRHGRVAPRDLSIACFQRRNAGGAFSGPAIDFFEIGRRAAHLAEQPRRPPQCVRVGTVWNDAGSIGPPPVLPGALRTRGS